MTLHYIVRLHSIVPRNGVHMLVINNTSSAAEKDLVYDTIKVCVRVWPTRLDNECKFFSDQRPLVCTIDAMF